MPRIRYFAGTALPQQHPKSGPPRLRLHVRTIAPDGTDVVDVLSAGLCTCISFAPGLAWSPDGTELALQIPAPGNGGGDGIYVVNADGSGLRLVTSRIGSAIAWRPAP